MKVLVVGRSGQLAQALSRSRWPDGMQGVFLGRPALDVRDPASIAATIDANAPDLILNTSAYTAVDKAESDADAAFALNAEGPRNLARAAAAHKVPLVHLSSDYVFSGPKQRPWREDDPVVPQGVYARSKYQGEQAVREMLNEHVILRTSWVFSAGGTNFVHTMLKAAEEKPTLSIVDDQCGCPTWADDLARVLIEMAAKRGPHGTYHYCGSGPVTWFDFAREIFARSKGKRPDLKRISTAAFGSPAPRPEWSVLDTAKILRDYGIEQRPWREGLDQVMQDLAVGR